MSDKSRSSPIWRRPDVYVGLMFMGVAALGLVLAQSYPVGTAVRMGTGYVPRLLCWALLALGGVVLLIGLVKPVPASEEIGSKDLGVLRALFFVTLATIVFAFTIESLGLVIGMLLTILVGAFATRSLTWLETIIAMIVLTAACWGIFSYGLALPFPVWPRF